MQPQTDRAAWLHAGAVCSPGPPDSPGPPVRLVLLGAPGAGKGTQAELLSDALQTCQLSTGDVFRAARCQEPDQLSPALKAALAFMNRGELVPDQTVIDMVRERAGCIRCRSGFMLDGFPRTTAQATALEAMLREQGLQLDAVIDYELSTAEIVARLSGRRTCRECCHTCHITFSPPLVAGVCDKCSGELWQRDDDQPEAIMVRLDAYQECTRPLIDFYRERDLLVSVGADGPPETVFQRSLVLLRPRLPFLAERGGGSA